MTNAPLGRVGCRSRTNGIGSAKRLAPPYASAVIGTLATAVRRARLQAAAE